MTLDETIDDGWNRHDKDSAGVFAAARDAIARVDEAKHVDALGRLLFHVGGEHLGRWNETLDALAALRARPACGEATASDRALWRLVAACWHCAGDAAKARDAEERGLSGGDVRPEADRGVVAAFAAAALVGQRRVDEAAQHFQRALDCAAYGPVAGDSLARALAVTGNNLACELEERKDRSAAEDRLMLEAAKTGRKFWEIAGSWTHVERAEYRLAMTCVKLGRAEDALAHANKVLEICAANAAEAGELFFGHEAVAKAQKLAGRVSEARAAVEKASEQLPKIADEGFRKYCAGELEKLKQLVG